MRECLGWRQNLELELVDNNFTSSHAHKELCSLWQVSLSEPYYIDVTSGVNESWFTQYSQMRSLRLYSMRKEMYKRIMYHVHKFWAKTTGPLV